MSGFNKDLKRGEMFFIQKSSDYVECGSEPAVLLPLIIFGILLPKDIS